MKTTFEITEEQIKDIALGGGKTKIKEMFPEVFEPKETPEQFFDSIFNKDLTRKVDFDKYPNSQFYFDGETLMLEIEKRGETLYAWFNYFKIWNPISTKNNWNYDQTQAFLKVRIEEHFKLRDVTPRKRQSIFSASIEEHFKLRDVTPQSAFFVLFARIEEHFKLRDVTPTIKNSSNEEIQKEN